MPPKHYQLPYNADVIAADRTIERLELDLLRKVAVNP